MDNQIELVSAKDLRKAGVILPMDIPDDYCIEKDGIIVENTAPPAPEKGMIGVRITVRFTKEFKKVN